MNKCHHIISSCYHLRSNYIACRYHTGIVVCNILINKTYKHQCRGPCQVVFSDNLYLNEYIYIYVYMSYMYYLSDRTSTPSCERLWQISTACWRNIHSTQQVDCMDRSQGHGVGGEGNIHTVDGRNPAPVDMVNIPLFIGFYTSQVV